MSVAPESIKADIDEFVGYRGIVTGTRNKSGESDIEVNCARLETPTSSGAETASLTGLSAWAGAYEVPGSSGNWRHVEHVVHVFFRGHLCRIRPWFLLAVPRGMARFSAPKAESVGFPPFVFVRRNWEPFPSRFVGGFLHGSFFSRLGAWVRLGFFGFFHSHAMLMLVEADSLVSQAVQRGCTLLLHDCRFDR